jgi:hypothetical protein
MKLNLQALTLLTLSLAITQLVQGQVTITAANAPVAGDAYASKPLNVPGGTTFTFQKNGAGLNWDFTTLAAGTGGDTTYFLKPSATPASASFPTAMLASKVKSKKEYIYYNMTSSSLYIVGAYVDYLKNGNMKTLRAVPPLTLLTLPYTYNSKFIINSYSFIYGTGAEANAPQYDSVKVKHTVTDNVAVTGYGTLKTPAGTFANSLIEKKLETSFDSTFIKGTATTGNKWVFATASKPSTDSTFNFYDGSTFLPIFVIAYTGGSINYITYYSKKFSVVTGLAAENSNAIASVYPNPISNHATFEFTNAPVNAKGYNLSIYEINGKLADEVQSIAGSSYVYQNKSLSKGVYFYKLTDGIAVAGYGKLVVE